MTNVFAACALEHRVEGREIYAEALPDGCFLRTTADADIPTGRLGSRMPRIVFFDPGVTWPSCQGVSNFLPCPHTGRFLDASIVRTLTSVVEGFEKVVAQHADG